MAPRRNNEILVTAKKNTRAISVAATKDKGREIKHASFFFIAPFSRPIRKKISNPSAAITMPLAPPTIFATGALLALTVAVQASPLKEQSFDYLASRCAPSVKLSTLRAVASVESHFEPWALRDNRSHRAWIPQSLSAALTLAESRLRLGHSIDLGLMQINSENLTSLGMGMNDAFDPCRSLGAASRILLASFAAGNSETERQAAVLIALSRYNTGRPLAGFANGYIDRVIAAQGKSEPGRLAQPSTPNISPQWDIWGTSNAAPPPWVLTTSGSSEIERAGAQTSDARNEGRAPASPSEKGEPYELSAYQESRPNRP